MLATTDHATDGATGYRRRVVLRRDAATTDALETVTSIPVEVHLGRREGEAHIRMLTGTVEVDRISGEAALDLGPQSLDEAPAPSTHKRAVAAVLTELWGSAPVVRRWSGWRDSPTGARYQAIVHLR